jgi:general stress protein YciG
MRGERSLRPFSSPGECSPSPPPSPVEPLPLAGLTWPVDHLFYTETTMASQSVTDTRGRGFASLDASRQREIASRGGQAAHRKGTAHEFTPEEARAAGRKGGMAISANREHMAEIGRRGGRARGNGRHMARRDGAKAAV